MDSIVPWYHSFYPALSSSFSKKKRRLINTSLFFTANTDSSSNDPPSMPWIDVARPPHRTAMHWQYLCMISL
jgi:hypothetical protein